MESSTSYSTSNNHLLVGFAYGATLAVIAVLTFNTLEILAMPLVILWPVLGAYLFRTNFPEKTNYALLAASLGIAGGGIVGAIFLMQRTNDGFADLAALALAIMGIFYSIVFFIVGFLFSKLFNRGFEAQ